MVNTATTSTQSPLASERITWWQAIAAGVIVSVVANLVVYFVGTVAGASFLLIDNGSPQQIGPVDVVISAAAPLAIGTALAVLVARWWQPVLRVAQAVAAVLALLTIAGPAMAETDTATIVSLGLMHVLAGTAAVAVLEVIRRSRHSRTRP
ncbi:DUF6069 family protein [Haloechinothrix halophila]|uniref:DUF6069 family protein n=1 Tax=Haloechinothrix halophila TaxID=1069073 RepID=UPI0012FBCEC9|nr:DUF6069 family protein [Haloechinothrix halophila]